MGRERLIRHRRWHGRPGILTINSPSDCYEYSLYSPKGIWNKYVSNSRGWIIETSLKVDPITLPGNVEIWANDHTILIIVYFNTNEIYIAYPEQVHFPMDTTDGFHVYRIEAKGMHVKIYVDGSLAIDHMLSSPGLGTEALVFGDGDGTTSPITFSRSTGLTGVAHLFAFFAKGGDVRTTATRQACF